MKAFHRRFKETWMQGAFEFQLVLYDELLKTARNEDKKRTLAEMGAALGCGPYVLVHFHSLLDLNGICAETATEWLEDRYPEFKAVRMTRTHEEQPLDEKCEKLADYCVKGDTKYTFRVVDEIHYEGRSYTFGELGDLITLHDSIQSNGYKNMLIGFNGSDSDDDAQ